MEETKLILITNDDGYNSPGLKAAASALADLGELLIVAPLDQQSGLGRAWLPGTTGVIHRREIALEGGVHQAYAVDGSPSQAVVHALLELSPRKPSLVVSGINYGENLGPAVTSSGTVGAALEAAISGIPSMAVSLEVDKEFYFNHSDQVDFCAAAAFVRLFARQLLSVQLPADVDLLKIEVPRDAKPDTPWEVTRQSRRRYFVSPSIKREALDKPAVFDYSLDPFSSLPGTDTHTMACRRRVAVTPISFDLTSRTDLVALGNLLSDGRHSPST